MELNVGDKILYRQDDKIYEAVIKSIQGDKVEIDDNTIKLFLVGF